MVDTRTIRGQKRHVLGAGASCLHLFPQHMHDDSMTELPSQMLCTFCHTMSLPHLVPVTIKEPCKTCVTEYTEKGSSYLQVASVDGFKVGAHQMMHRPSDNRKACARVFVGDAACFRRISENAATRAASKKRLAKLARVAMPKGFVKLKELTLNLTCVVDGEG
eukprot:6482941-Amphidinium_carterae.2